VAATERASHGWSQKSAPFVEKLSLNLDYSDWHHQELAGGVVGTEFVNRQYSYRAVADQRPRGGLSGSFGVNGLRRSYKVRGEEQITPPVTQTSFALFGLEEIPLERARVQLGGRLETNRYSPEGKPGRAFTGFSGSAGVNTPLWKDGAFVRPTATPTGPPPSRSCTTAARTTATWRSRSAT